MSEAVMVSFSDALHAAVVAQQDGDFNEAETIFRRLLEVAPDDATVLHFLGMTQIHMRQFSDGEATVRRSLKSDPDYGDAWNTLGNLYRLTDRPDDALDAYQRVTTLQPDNCGAWVNLGDLYASTANAEGATRAFARAYQLAEEDESLDASIRSKVMRSVAFLLAMQGKWDAAAPVYDRALELDPDDMRLKREGIEAWCRGSDREEGLARARAWVEAEPEHPFPQRLLASLTGENVPARTTDDEITSLFDKFSGTFDTHLARLKYVAPKLLHRAVNERLGEPRGSLQVCDAGCGTGLCGPWLRPYASRLVGVDLSQGMLDGAALRGGYDELDRAELTAWLAARPATFDLIVSADTLCYFGDLTGFSAAAADALKPAGILAFTVERMTEDAPAGYHVQSNGRYIHARDYVVKSILDAGFVEVDVAEASLRMELGRPVHGLIVVASKPAA